MEFNLFTKCAAGEPPSACPQAGLADTAVLEAPWVAFIQDFRLPPTKLEINENKPQQTTRLHPPLENQHVRPPQAPLENGVRRRLTQACLQLFYRGRSFSDVSHLFYARWVSIWSFPPLTTFILLLSCVLFTLQLFKNPPEVSTVQPHRRLSLPVKRLGAFSLSSSVYLLLSFFISLLVPQRTWAQGQGSYPAHSAEGCSQRVTSRPGTKHHCCSRTLSTVWANPGQKPRLSTALWPPSQASCSAHA